MKASQKNLVKKWPFSKGDHYSVGDLFLHINAAFFNTGLHSQDDLYSEAAYRTGLTASRMQFWHEKT